MEAGIARKPLTLEEIAELVPEPVAKKRGPYKVRGANEMEGGVVLILIAAILVGLWLLAAAFIGALTLFVLASEQGFIGIAAYIACWVFFFPVMLIVCIIFGLITMFSN